MSLLSLPNELLLMIFSYVSTHEHCMLLRTNRRLYALVTPHLNRALRAYPAGGLILAIRKGSPHSARAILATGLVSRNHREFCSVLYRAVNLDRLEIIEILLDWYGPEGVHGVGGHWMDAARGARIDLQDPDRRKRAWAWTLASTLERLVPGCSGVLAAEIEQPGKLCGWRIADWM